MLFEVCDEIRRRVGSEYPVLVKLNQSDQIKDGFTQEECLWVCQQLNQRGISGIELSCGLGVAPESTPVPLGLKNEGFNLEAALMIAQEVPVPITCVGGFRSRAFIEEAINRGNLAAISMCRPLIRDPQLPNRWKAGTMDASDCVSCNRCYGAEKHGCALR